MSYPMRMEVVDGGEQLLHPSLAADLPTGTVRLDMGELKRERIKSNEMRATTPCTALEEVTHEVAVIR